MEDITVDNIINKSQKKISALSAVFDYTILVLVLTGYALDIYIIVSLFLLGKLSYAIACAVFVGITHLLILASSLSFEVGGLRIASCYCTFSHVAFSVLVSLSFCVQSTIWFVYTKYYFHLEEEEENDHDDKYPQWRWFERRSCHWAYCVQAIAQQLPFCIIYIIFILRYRPVDVLDDVKLLMQISILLWIVISALLSLIFVVDRISNTFTTAIFCWLCVFTDVMGMVAIIYLLFHDREQFVILNENAPFFYDFLALGGYFNLFGQFWLFLWLFTVPISIMLMFVGIVACFDGDVAGLESERTCTAICIGIPAVIILTVFASLLSQFCMFTFLVIVVQRMLVWRFTASNRYSSNDSLRRGAACAVTSILHFVQEMEQDSNAELLRLIICNFAAYEVVSENNSYAMRHTMNALNHCKEEENLLDITYADLREMSKLPIKSNLIKRCWEWYTVQLEDYKLQMRLEKQSGDWCAAAMHAIQFTIGILLLFVCIPIWCIGKLLSVLLPWVYLVICLSAGSLDKENYVQFIVLCLHLVLQILVFVVAYFVYQQQYVLWHIACGITRIDMVATPFQFVRRMLANYKEIEWIPVVKEALIEKFGPDVGKLIFKYTMTMSISQKTDFDKPSERNKIVHDSGVSYQYGSLFDD